MGKWRRTSPWIVVRLGYGESVDFYGNGNAVRGDRLPDEKVLDYTRIEMNEAIAVYVLWICFHI